MEFSKCLRINADSFQKKFSSDYVPNMKLFITILSAYLKSVVWILNLI